MLQIPLIISIPSPTDRQLEIIIYPDDDLNYSNTFPMWAQLEDKVYDVTVSYDVFTGNTYIAKGAQFIYDVKKLNFVESPPTEEEICIFNSYIETTVFHFTDRPHLWGYVKNCPALLHESHYVTVKVIDWYGKVVKDDWKQSDAKLSSQRPQLYKFTDEIQQTGVELENQYDKQYVYPNQFNFYAPQLNSVHFTPMIICL